MSANQQLAEALQIGEDFANECISAHIAAYGETWPSQNRKLESLREDLRKIQAARAALDSELAQRLAQDAALDAAVAAEQAYTADEINSAWLLVGADIRGLDWSAFVDALRVSAPRFAVGSK